MNKPSDRLDFVDKILELRNFYLENQKYHIRNEIIWLNEHYEDIQSLRQHLLSCFPEEQVLQLNDKAVQELAEFRGNYLFSQFCGLDRQKIETRPLKIIAQELKSFGK